MPLLVTCPSCCELPAQAAGPLWVLRQHQHHFGPAWALGLGNLFGSSRLSKDQVAIAWFALAFCSAQDDSAVRQLVYVCV